MNITRENTSNVNAVIRILIEKPDYEKTVEDTLKDYRQKSSIPGFRPGKAPMGLVKRRVGKAILADEINKMLSQNLSRYLVEEKLQILGEPLSSHEHQKNIDWDTDENFEFAFDIALSPEINLNLDENIQIDYYRIKVTDEMVDQQVNLVTAQMGQQVEAEVIDVKTLVRGDFTELDENGNQKEAGITANGVLLSLGFVKDDEIKQQFIGKKKDDIIIFNPVTAYQDQHEVGHLLHISHEQAHDLNSDFSFKVTEITNFEKAELNEELFRKMYGDDTEIKTEADLRNRLKEEIAGNLQQSSDRRFATDARDKLVELVNPELPEEFLRRWLRESNKDVTEEQIENEFSGFMKDLSWQLIKGDIAGKNDLKVDESEILEFARKVALVQYAQYGMYNASEEQIESFAKMLIGKPEEKERLYNKLLEDKVIEVIKAKVTVTGQEVTREEFEENAK